METETWKHITLGELYRSGVAKARQARRSFKQYSSLKLDLTAARNLWGAISPLVMAPILHVLEGFRPDRLLPPVVDTTKDLTPKAIAPSIPHKPWYRRTERVHQWIDGTPLLIAGLMTFTILRFIGLGLNSTSLYLFGGILAVAVGIFRLILYSLPRKSGRLGQ